MLQPRITNDARFRAGRALVTQGKAQDAVDDVFAVLLDETRKHHGPTSIETAPAYYEYGNALLRILLVEQIEEAERKAEETTNEAKKVSREAAAAAAERRMKSLQNGNDTLDNIDKFEDTRPEKTGSSSLANDLTVTKEAKIKHEDTNEENQNSDSGNDWQLALEMMETAWSIVDEYLESHVNNDSSNNKKPDTSDTSQSYVEWATDQSPRYLTGIGDLLSATQRHADAADAYRRALSLRQAMLDKLKDNTSSKAENVIKADPVRYLECRRKIVESCTLLAEEILQCSADQDVVTTESKEVIFKAGDQIGAAKAYYNQARDELQEAVLLMADLARKGCNISSEKEDICYASTLVMGLGMLLAETEENSRLEPAKKKAKS